MAAAERPLGAAEPRFSAGFRGGVFRDEDDREPALAEALVDGKIPATVATPVLRAALAGHSKDVMELAEPALSKRDPSASAQRALVEKLLKGFQMTLEKMSFFFFLFLSLFLFCWWMRFQ